MNSEQLPLRRKVRRASYTPGKLRYMGLLPAKTPYGAGLYVTTTETSAHSVYNARTSFTEATAGSITDGMTTAGYHRDLWVVYETDGVEENEFGPVSP